MERGRRCRTGEAEGRGGDLLAEKDDERAEPGTWVLSRAEDLDRGGQTQERGEGGLCFSKQQNKIGTNGGAKTCAWNALNVLNFNSKKRAPSNSTNKTN